MSKRIPELDGLRGIAILLVMVFHFASYRPPASPPIQLVIFGSLSLGWMGVDLFFVLSGFLITGILLDTKASPHYLRVFYIRRTLRILPIYYLSVILFFWVAPHLLPMRPAVRAARIEQIWYWLHIANWRTGFYPLKYPFVTHFWSLAIEEQFYLFWPLVVLKCSKQSLLRLALGGVLLACLLRNLPWAQALGSAWPNSLYRLTPFRIDTLLLGACAAIVIRDSAMIRTVRDWIRPVFFTSCAALALVLLVARDASPHSAPMTRFGYTALGLIFVSAVLYGAICSGADTRLLRFLRSAPLRFFGKYSYAMYVFHVAVADLSPRFPVAPWGGLLTTLMSIVAGTSITVLVAALSWSVVESRFLHLSDRLTSTSSSTVRRCAIPEPLVEFQ